MGAPRGPYNLCDPELHDMAAHRARSLGERDGVETHDEERSPPIPRLSTAIDRNPRTSSDVRAGEDGRTGERYIIFTGRI